MPIELMDISISRPEPPKRRIARRFDDGTVELLMPNGLRAKRMPYNCSECGAEEVQHGLNNASLKLIQSGLCHFCFAKELLRREEVLEQEKATRRANGLSARMRRYFAQALATPMWRDRAAIAAVYAKAKRLTEETGVPHDVDHIYPIQSPYGCGLHVHWNLQVLEKTQNVTKGNTFPLHDSPALR